MYDLHKGDVIPNVNTVRKVYAKLIPESIKPQDTMWKVGYEAAKEDILNILTEELPEELKHGPARRVYDILGG